MTVQGGIFGSSSFCGEEDPEQPGWQCVMRPNHAGYDHVYGPGIRQGTLPREVDKGADKGAGQPDAGSGEIE